MAESPNVLIVADSVTVHHVAEFVKRGSISRPIHTLVGWKDIKSLTPIGLEPVEIAIHFPPINEPIDTMNSVLSLGETFRAREGIVEHGHSTHLVLLPAPGLESDDDVTGHAESQSEIQKASASVTAVIEALFTATDFTWTRVSNTKKQLTYSVRPYIEHLLRRWLKKHPSSYSIKSRSGPVPHPLVAFDETGLDSCISALLLDHANAVILPYNSHTPDAEDVDLLIQLGRAFRKGHKALHQLYAPTNVVLDWPDEEIARPELGNPSLSDALGPMGRLRETLIALHDIPSGPLLPSYLEELETSAQELVGLLHVIESWDRETARQSGRTVFHQLDLAIASVFEAASHFLSFSGGSSRATSVESKRSTSEDISSSSPDLPFENSDSSPLLLGRYRSLEKIGAGSTGDVYHGIDEKLKRPVAIKILPEGPPPSPEELERFRREAQALAKINHAHVVQIYDFNETGPRPYLVLEYIDGRSLRDCICDVTPLSERIRLLIRIAEAVQCAHDARLIHRDLNPNNILIRKDGVVKVIDFGLTRFPGVKSVTLSNEGGLGTTNYISPEQQRYTKHVDIRTDIYSFGCLLYFVCMETDPVPAARLRLQDPQVSADLVAQFERCVHSSPDERPESMREVVSALGAILRKLEALAAASAPEIVPEAHAKKTAISVTKAWTPDPQGYPGYSLIAQCHQRIEDGTIQFLLPVGFALRRGKPTEAWYSDPSLDRPKMWLDASEPPNNSAVIGRLCYNVLTSRITDPLASVEWIVSGKNLEEHRGTLPVDLDTLLPMQARAALASTRKLSFPDSVALAEINYSTDGRKIRPSLLRDSEEGCLVLRSADPGADRPLYFDFDPHVHLPDSRLLRFRIKANASKHLMFHVFLKNRGGQDYVLTYKSYLAGDQPERQHSRSERVISIDRSFGTGTWQTFDRDLEADLTRMLQEAQPPASLEDLSIRKLSIRGDYWLNYIEFSETVSPKKHESEQSSVTPPQLIAPASGTLRLKESDPLLTLECFECPNGLIQFKLNNLGKRDALSIEISLCGTLIEESSALAPGAALDRSKGVQLPQTLGTRDQPQWAISYSDRQGYHYVVTYDGGSKGAWWRAKSTFTSISKNGVKVYP